MKQKKFWLPSALLALAVATVFLILPGRSGGEAARASRAAPETPKAASRSGLFEDDDTGAGTVAEESKAAAETAKAADVEPRHEETKLGELSDGETFYESEFSDDGCHIACVVKKGDKQLVALDGKLGPEFDEVEYLSISPDGKRVAYWAKRAGKGYVVIDHRIGPQYDTLESISYPTKIAFSPDGKRMAYLVVKGEKKFLVIDGKPEPEFDEVSAFTFSPDGKRFGYKVRPGDEYRFVVDGRLGLKAATYGGLTFSPDGKRLACGIAWGHGEQYYIVDGVKEQGYDRTDNFAFNPDGKHYAYAARPDKDADYVVVVDGKPKWPGYDAVNQLTFSPDGRRLAYVASRGADEQFLVVNGKAGPPFDEVSKYSGQLAFSPDSKHLAYVAVQTTLVYDGEQQEPKYRMIWGMTFSPDSAHLAYKAANGGEFVVVDGKPGPKYDKLSFEPLAFRADGAVEYLAYKEGWYYRVRQSSPAWVSAPASQTKPVAATEETPAETRKTTGRRSLFEDEEPTPTTEATTPKRTQPARTRKVTRRSGLFEDEEPPETETTAERERPSTTAAPARRSALFEDEEPAPATQPSTRRQPSTGARTRAAGLFEDEEPATKTKAEGATGAKAAAPRKGISLDLGDGVSMKLVLVPAGKFMMGSPKDEIGDDEARQNEGPQHDVTISKPFFMGVTEVTQGQYEAVMGKSPSEYKGANRPVEMVSWDEAAEFCAKLTEKVGREVRLATEAEWEYACRAGSTGRYCFGDDEKSLGDYAWVWANSGGYGAGPHPVGSKKPNAWGLYDMHGNVYEWCSDWYRKTYYKEAKPVDPQGPKSGEWRIARGGSWISAEKQCRCAERYMYEPDTSLGFLGFRVVADLTSEELRGQTPALAEQPAQAPDSKATKPSGLFEDEEAAPETKPAPEKEAPAKTPAEEKELSLDLGGNVSMKLALIPPGKFMIGASASEQNAGADEKPQHEVVISKPFYMGVHEVTQEEYQAVTGKNPSPAEFKGAKNPAVMLTWDDMQEFCKEVSAKTGKTVRLPTEAEWEYACCAGTTTPFNTGATITTDQANYDGNYVYGSGRKGVFRKKLTPVGSFKPNAWGLFDMHGNVWERCTDWYGAGYYASPNKNDPQGPTSGKARVVRGGSYKDGPSDCRSASRAWLGISPQGKNPAVGFRVVVEATPVVP